MNSKEAKKLTRAELLELLIEQTEENQRLTQNITRLEATLAQRLLVMERSGSIAEAALSLSGVFTKAQDAADRYLLSIRKKEEESDSLVSQARQKAQAILEQTETECEQFKKDVLARCAQLERETESKCEKLLHDAEQKARECPVNLSLDFSNPGADERRPEGFSSDPLRFKR